MRLTDGQGHEDLLDDVRDEVGHNLATLVRRGDVVKDQLVRSVGLVALRLLHGIAGVDVIEELDPFDHAAAIDVEAGDDSSSEHGEKSRQ